MYGSRGMGQTTAAIGTLYQNKNAALVVAGYGHKRSVINQHPMLKDRVFTVDEVQNQRLWGTTYFMVWDNAAVHVIANTEYIKGRALGQKEGLAVGTSMHTQEREKPVSTVDTDTMNQLAKVLKEVGEMYNVNILVVPKPKE